MAWGACWWDLGLVVWEGVRGSGLIWPKECSPCKCAYNLEIHFLFAGWFHHRMLTGFWQCGIMS